VPKKQPDGTLDRAREPLALSTLRGRPVVLHLFNDG
jgi:hypothetical protein